MHGRGLLVLAVFLSVSLAGCAGDEPSKEKQFQEAVKQGQAAQLPEWKVGDYWTYQLSGGGNTIGTSSLVVTGEQGGDYIVETDDKSVAYYDARFDIIFMGQIRKSDLAGSQGSERVAMFQWPLEAGMEWTTTWGGQKLDMAASSMGPNQFHVMGHRDSDGEMTVEYHYNAAKRWFEYIVFYDADNGTEAFRLDLEKSGPDFKGTIYRYAFGEAHHFMAVPEESRMEEQDIAAEWNELSVTMVADCGGAAAGTVAIGLSSEQYTETHPLPMFPVLNEPEYGTMAACHETGMAMDNFILSNQGGTWSFGLVAGAPDSMAMLVIEERAVTAVPFPTM